MDELKNNEVEENDENEYLTLTDDDGNDVHFEILDEFPYKERNYIVLIPFDDTEDEVVILEIIQSDDSEDEEFLSIEDDALLGEIFEEFKRRNADKFDFAE